MQRISVDVVFAKRFSLPISCNQLYFNLLATVAAPEGAKKSKLQIDYGVESILLRTYCLLIIYG